MAGKGDELMINWDNYENFSEREFDCKHTGKNEMRPEFMDTLQDIRTAFGKPMVVTSGFRDKEHPVEARKSSPGEHTYGLAVDIAVRGLDALDLMVIAYGHGIRRIGIKQHGSGRYIHLGMGDKNLNFPQSVWTYKGD